MSFTHTIQTIYSGTGTALDKSKSISAGSEQNISEAIADSTTDALIAGFTCDYSQLKMIMIFSDQTITLETNSPSAADQTITITAGVPFVWIYESGITNPITTDVTALYATNASGSTANLEIRKLEDPTA